MVDKKLDEGRLTRKEEARLAYVRWHLDRIEDARIGASLDELERLAQLHEAISADVTSFVAHVRDVSAKPRRKR